MTKQWRCSLYGQFKSKAFAVRSIGQEASEKALENNYDDAAQTAHDWAISESLGIAFPSKTIETF